MTPTLEETAERVDRAVEKVRALDEPARADALEVKNAIEESHKDGLTRIVRHLRADPRGKELLLEVAADPAVYALLAMHGIVKTKPPPPQTGGFVPLTNLTMAPGWKPGPQVSELTEARPYRFDIEQDASILLLKLNGRVNAFRNECAHRGLPLDGGMVDAEACTITCPWHGFRFDGTTGECLTNPRSRLERIEMKIESGVIMLRPV